MQKTNPSNKLTKKQIEILILIYRFRFLNRVQIQKLLNHKKYSRVIVWLNDLTENKYLNRYTSVRFTNVPSIYSLGVSSRKYFRKNKNDNIQITLLNRVWKEHQYSVKFRNHCMLLADIYLSLLSLVNQTKAKLHFYTKTDLSKMKYLIHPEPDAYFSLKEENNLIKRYFLEIIDDLPARMVLRRRVRQYFNYLEKNYWQEQTKHPFPEIIIICPDTTSFNYLKKYIGRELEEKEKNLLFYLSTRLEMKTRGISRNTLHKVEIRS